MEGLGHLWPGDGEGLDEREEDEAESQQDGVTVSVTYFNSGK